MNSHPRRIGIIGLFLLLSLFYLAYVKIQNANVFLEAQFIHFPFLKDLVAHQFQLKHFFSVFHEHLFPGYNIILAINYYLFRVWGGFDDVVYALFFILTAGVVVLRIYNAFEGANVKKFFAVSLSLLMLLSITASPAAGMVLAADIGIFLLIVSLICIEEAFWEESPKVSAWFFIIFPISIFGFLGGYAIGAVVVTGALLAVRLLQNKSSGQSYSAIKSIGAALLGSLFLYLALINRYGGLTDYQPTTIAVCDHFFSIIKFGIVMAGASVLGKAFFEHYQLLWPYYILGSLLMSWGAVVLIDGFSRPRKGKIFIGALALYSLTTICFVMLFRYRNGIDGALGSWYNQHTHFIAVAVICYLLSQFEKNFNVKQFLAVLTLFIVFCSAVLGYRCEWQKAPYVRIWKERLAAPAFSILVAPEYIQNKKDLWQTMLWDFETVKEALAFMCANRLWIFNTSEPVIMGPSKNNVPSNQLILMSPNEKIGGFDFYFLSQGNLGKFYIKHL